MKKVIIIIFVISLLMYHGCVVKTESIYNARLWGQLQDGKIPQQEYERLKEENSYFKHFFNFSEVLKAVD
jgi:hypothetical protein